MHTDGQDAHGDGIIHPHLFIRAYPFHPWPSVPDGQSKSLYHGYARMGKMHTEMGIIHPHLFIRAYPFHPWP